MSWFDLGGITWWAVGVAFIVTVGFGAFYYSPRGVFTMWARLGKITPDDVNNADMRIAFGGTFLGNALGIILLAVLFEGLGVTGWAAGLATGAILGLIFRGGAHVIHNGFAVRHPGITLLDTAHDTIALAIAGAILGAAG